MKAIYFLLLASWICQTCLGSGHSGASHSHLSSRQARVVGGRPARASEYPYQVALYFRSGPFYSLGCGGSIYNNQYILTAAHCLHNTAGDRLDASQVRVLLGETNVRLLIPANSSELLQVGSVFVHGNYDGKPSPILVQNDIALVRLSTPIVYTARARKIRIANRGEQGINNGLADLTGWGRVEVHRPNGQPVGGDVPLRNPRELRVARLRVIPRQLCTIRYLAIVPDTLLCVGSEGLLDNQSACYGDSGSPLTCNSVSGPFQCGVVSNGMGCGLRFTPAFYTDVGRFNDWIVRVAGPQ